MIYYIRCDTNSICCSHIPIGRLKRVKCIAHHIMLIICDVRVRLNRMYHDFAGHYFTRCIYTRYSEILKIPI